VRIADADANGLAKCYTYCSCYGYTYCSRYGYTHSGVYGYTNG